MADCLIASTQSGIVGEETVWLRIKNRKYPMGAEYQALGMVAFSSYRPMVTKPKTIKTETM